MARLSETLLLQHVQDAELVLIDESSGIAIPVLLTDEMVINLTRAVDGHGMLRVTDGEDQFVTIPKSDIAAFFFWLGWFFNDPKSR